MEIIKDFDTKLIELYDLMINSTEKKYDLQILDISRNYIHLSLKHNKKMHFRYQSKVPYKTSGKPSGY